MRNHKPAILLALLIGILISMPQWLHMMNDQYRGVPVSLSSDEGYYQTHLQEALLGRFGQAGKGITAHSAEDPSFQLSVIEEVQGFLFQWTDLRASQVFQILDFIIPVLFALALYFLLLSYGFSKNTALIGTALFCLLQLANLNRPVHQRDNFLIVLVTLLSLNNIYKGNTKWILPGGAILGLLMSMHVWGWMAAWCVWGMMLLLTLIIQEWSTAKRLTTTGVTGVIVASPFLWRMISIRNHPAYQDAVDRGGLVHWRLPESLPWTVLFLVMAIVILLYWIQQRKRSDLIPIVSLACSGFIVFNQQLVHGYLLMFRSHFLFFLTLAAITVFFFSIKNRKSKILTASALSALVILAAVAYENKKVINQWTVNESRFASQYLVTAYPVLDALPRATILSDPDSSLFISSGTKHDVVYTVYLQHTLLTNKQIAEAFCLTQLPIPPADRNFEEHKILVLGNAIGSARDPIEIARMREEDLELVRNACDQIDADDLDAEYIFWNEKTQPLWGLDQLGIPMEKIEEDEGWSLWKIDQ